jgi:hypothetical protein
MRKAEDSDKFPPTQGTGVLFPNRGAEYPSKHEAATLAEIANKRAMLKGG